MKEDRVDRFARGELTPAEARDLAQEALNDPELFEELTFAALGKAAVAAPPAKVVAIPRRRVIWSVAAAAAAVIVGVVVYRASTVRAPVPKLETVLLAKDLFSPSASAPVFRGGDVGARAPRAEGSVVAVENGEATVDLGSLDGLEKGSVLEVPPGGRVTVTAVFREQVRGKIDGAVRMKDQVRVTGALRVRGLLDQVDALVQRGDLTAARTASAQAAQYVETTGGDLPRLAALEYRAGAVDATAKHYRMAGDAASWNSLGAILMMGGDLAGAESALQKAGGSSGARNNLGVLAELRGDRRKAEAYYREALRDAGEDRAVIDANLARVQGRR